MVRYHNSSLVFSCDNGLFGVVGHFVEGSEVEDVLFQTGLCISGSITGVMSGKHNNDLVWTSGRAIGNFQSCEIQSF